MLVPVKDAAETARRDRFSLQVHIHYQMYFLLLRGAGEERPELLGRPYDKPLQICVGIRLRVGIRIWVDRNHFGSGIVPIPGLLFRVFHPGTGQRNQRQG